MACQVKNTLNPFDQEETPLSFRFNVIAKKYYGTAGRLLSNLDFDRYFFILSLICKHEEITQQCLANCLEIDKATVVRVINYLTGKGLVKREINPGDKRAHLIKPTHKALEAMPFIEAAFNTLNQAAFKGFTKTEKEKFIELMTKMLDNLSLTANRSGEHAFRKKMKQS